MRDWLPITLVLIVCLLLHLNWKPEWARGIAKCLFATLLRMVAVSRCSGPRPMFVFCGFAF
jgi:hypothetical protein